jgi:uncharacterized membrane protein YraQ (UPF0718 family)
LNWKEEYKPLLWVLGLFVLVYLMPLGQENFNLALHEAFVLLQWYAREHVILCLVPAFFIAGVIAIFVSQKEVIKYFGAGTNKWLSYGVASVSGTILAVCSCTVLPLFSSIHKRGAGLGPAIAFLYSGPAINILAIILTARILGMELGVARIVGAVLFSVFIGLIMHFIYYKEEKERAETQLMIPEIEEKRPVWQTAFHFFVLVAILVFANWGKPNTESGFWYWLFENKWHLTIIFSILFVFSLIRILELKAVVVLGATALVLLTGIFLSQNPTVLFSIAIVVLVLLLSFSHGEPSEWMSSTWDFTKQILPLLAGGVLIAGFLLGSTESGQGIIPSRWISGLVGGNSLFANFFASLVGAFMYFATLTEVPILQGLLANGMGKGPALALLLAGPALSLPNMLVIRSVLGTQKTTVFVFLVVFLATVSGLVYGAVF